MSLWVKTPLRAQVLSEEKKSMWSSVAENLLSFAGEDGVEVLEEGGADKKTERWEWERQ